MLLLKESQCSNTCCQWKARHAPPCSMTAITQQEESQPRRINSGILTRFCWLKWLRSLNVNLEDMRKRACLHFVSTSPAGEDFNICFDSVTACSSVITCATQPRRWLTNSALGTRMKLSNQGWCFPRSEAWGFWNYHELRWYISSCFSRIICLFF